MYSYNLSPNKITVLLHGHLGSLLNSFSWVCWPGKNTLFFCSLAFLVWVWFQPRTLPLAYVSAFIALGWLTSRPRWLEERWSYFVCLRMSPVTCWILGEILGPSSNCPGSGASLLLILFVSSSCGSGLSGDYLTDEGHYWVGIDISPAMLGRYVLFSTGVDYSWVWSSYTSCLFPSHTLLQCRCSLGPRHRGRPAFGGHGPGHPLQTGLLWWLYQVSIFMFCLVLQASASHTCGCAEVI